MRHLKFTVARGEMGEGILPNIFKKWDSYYPSQTLGHDLIDHSTKEWGEVWQEFRASGAYLFNSDWLRFETYRWRGNKTDIQVLAEDFAENLESILSDSENFGEGEDVPEAPHVSLSSEEKDKFKYLWHLFRTHIENKYNEEVELEGEDFEYETRYNFLKSSGEKILGWWKYGYVNAKRRYKGEPYYAYQIKKTINQTIAHHWKTLATYVETGEEFTLSYSVEDNHCEITHRYGLI